MAKRFIGKGNLSSDGLMRKLVIHVQDADGRFRGEIFEEVPDVEAENRLRVRE